MSQIPGRSAALPEGVKDAHILIVDDMALMRKMIGMCLDRSGFENITYAEDGDEALAKIAESVPDIVILDLNMPKMSGYDVCRALRGDEKTADLPILVQSASETPEERVEVFAVGATDFVSKPINQPELLARVCMHLENKFLIKNLSDFRTRMKDELRMARDMQHSLLPAEDTLKNVKERAGASIEAFYKASFELGGDLWGAWPVDAGKVGLFVLDVTGHGVGAALNTFSLHATMARYEDRKHDPAAFLAAVNQTMAQTMKTGKFATMFYAVLDCETNALVYAGAGAPRPFILSEKGIRKLDSSGLPVGIVRSASYENLTDKLMPGESLFCYSDVLIEAEMPDGQMMGEDGLENSVRELLSSGDRQTLVGRFLDTYFKGQQENLPDDLTAVALHRSSSEGAAP